MRERRSIPGPYGGAGSGEEIRNPSTYFKKHTPQLYKWLIEIFTIDLSIDNYVVARKSMKDKSISFSLWTHEYEYVITAILPTGKMVERSIRRGKKSKVRDVGYLGAGCVRRAPYAGEQHRRGSDLYDGSFSEDTWRGIMKDIFLGSIVEFGSK